MIAPRLTEFLAIVMEEMIVADGSRGMRPSITYNPRAWRWLNAKQPANKSLVKVVDKEEGFYFRP